MYTICHIHLSGQTRQANLSELMNYADYLSPCPHLYTDKLDELFFLSQVRPDRSFVSSINRAIIGLQYQFKY